MIKRSFAASALTAVLALSALAAPATAQLASTDPNAVKAGVYEVEAYHTQVGFSLSHFGFTNYSGFFSNATGALTLDPANLGVSKLKVSIPVSSVLTTVPMLDSQLKGDQWFDAVQYPTATFVSTRITRTGPHTAIIVGALTLHGVTKPVTLKARLIGSGTDPILKAFEVGFEATGDINRSDFGIKQYLPLVGDDVTLTIAGSFLLKP
jgi:polyisoprenoid-binding protein YceI